MSIVGVSGKTSYIGASILNLRGQLDDLQSQLSSGKVSSTYAGQGPDRAFALGLRAQIANINAYADSGTNVQTRINVANLSLEGLANVGSSVKSASTSSTIVLNNNGQTSGQITAQAAFANAISMLNTQSGDRYLFSGRATDTAATVPANDMLYGTGTKAGLKQLIDERKQADQGPGGMGRLAVTAPPLTTTVTSLGEDGSAFGLKLASVSTTLSGATLTPSTGLPTGAPPAFTVDLGAVNPNNGEKVKFSFTLPDGTTESFELTALTTTTTPPAAGTFQIDPTGSTANTTLNLQAALTASVKTLADTSLVAASAIKASDNFFNPSATIVGGSVNNKDTVPAPITGATLLNGAAPTDSLATNFAAGDTITVNGTPITFVASGAVGNQLNITDNVQALLQKIDSITGTTNPSTVNAGTIVLHGGNDTGLTVTSSNTAAFTALGFGAAAVTASPAPLRVGGPPFNTANALVAGTPANTVIWYTGEAGPDSARGTAVGRVDQSITVQYGARADEQAFRHLLQNVAVYAAVTTNAANPNASTQSTALSQRIGSNLAPQTGYQSLQDIQAEFAGAQHAVKSTTDRQAQLKGMAQTMLDSIEGISTDEVATKILALQTALQASYQTTATLYQTSLLKYL
jgi:flagellar hook-associated protein 3 FlgL